MKYFVGLVKIFVFSAKILPRLAATPNFTFASRQVWLLHIKTVKKKLKNEDIVSLFPCINSCKWEVTHSPSLPLQCPNNVMLFITALFHLENLPFSVCFRDSSTFVWLVPH